MRWETANEANVVREGVPGLSVGTYHLEGRVVKGQSRTSHCSRRTEKSDGPRPREEGSPARREPSTISSVSRWPRGMRPETYSLDLVTQRLSVT